MDIPLEQDLRLEIADAEIAQGHFLLKVSQWLAKRRGPIYIFSKYAEDWIPYVPQIDPEHLAHCIAVAERDKTAMLCALLVDATAQHAAEPMPRNTVRNSWRRLTCNVTTPLHVLWDIVRPRRRLPPPQTSCCFLVESPPKSTLRSMIWPKKATECDCPW